MPRRRLVCAQCCKIFSTHSSRRRKCYTCEPKAGTEKIMPSEKQKTTFGMAVSDYGAKSFDQGGAVTVVVSKHEQQRIEDHRPVERTKFENRERKGKWRK